MLHTFRPALPAFALTASLFVSILCLLFSAYLPTPAVVWLASGVAIVGFLWGRFCLVGLALGVVAVGCFAAVPYDKTFSHCQFSAHLVRPNYSQRAVNKTVYLQAEHILCDQGQLPAQTLSYWDDKRQLQPLIGQRLQLRATLSPVRARLNPQAFDYEKYLLAKGIRLRAKKISLLSRTPETQRLLNARQHVANNLFSHLSHDNASLLLALLTGNRSAMSPEQKASLQATGTSHLLAISGLHLALVGGVVWLLGQWLWGASWWLSARLTPRHAGAILALLAITAYALFTGFDIPVKRAWLMFSLLLLSWLLGRGISLNSLLLSASAVMFFSPYAVVSVGFYFSFIATFVVLWSARLPYRPLIQVLIMQALINLVLAPITWGIFGVLPLSALFINLLVIPWLGVWVLPWSIVACLLEPLSSTLAAPIWNLLEHTTNMMWQTIVFAEQLGWTLYPSWQPSLIAMILAVGASILALLLRRKVLLLGTLAVFLPPLSPHPPPALIVADRAYTTALIHNGDTAILVNAGRRYRQINDAALWYRYLQQHGLQLGAIVLENDKLTRISATQWLLDAFPDAKVITLRRFPLPYANDYCRAIAFPHLALNVQQRGKRCQAELQWFEKSIALFPQSPTANTLGAKSTLTWQGKAYQARQLGALILQHRGQGVHVDALRWHQRLWRSHRMD